MSTRPSILVIQADQFSAAASSLYGGFARTPGLEMLAERGILFDTAYCNYPLCAPSRFSMLTGLMPFSIGAFDNAAELPASIPTVAHYLRQCGYRTCLSGKMHFIGPDQLHGFEERVTTDIYPADFAWLPNWETREQGFEPIRNTVERGGVAAYNLQIAFDEDAVHQAGRKIFEYARDPEQPFFLFVSLTHPHHPFIAPPRFWEMYRDEDIPAPTVQRLPDAELDPHSRRVRALTGFDDRDVSDEQRQRARHAYFAAVSYFDDRVASLLGTLDEAGLTDTTAIVVTADHGEMLGERGLWAKDTFHEWAMRIPLLLSMPGAGAGTSVDTAVSLMDLAPTLLHMAQVPRAILAQPLAGHSLMEIAGDPGSHAGRQVLAEYSAEAAEAPMVMIRRGAHKYIHGDTDPPQLFDLDRDPLELKNLAVDPQSGKLCRDFEQIVARQWDLPRTDAEIRLSQARRRLVSGALATGQHTPWDFEPRPDHSRTHVRGRVGSEAVDRAIRIPARGYPPA